MRKAVLVYTRKSLNYIVDELKTLCKAAGINIECTVVIKEPKRLSEEKIKEIKKCIEEKYLDTVVIEPELPPSTILRIEKETGKEVIDRTHVILMVFEKNAGSAEAKLQIQMARLRHVLPLLRERVNLAKRGEMPGFMAGGLIATEKYYRHAQRMIKSLQKKLTEISNRRALLRNQRKNLNIPVISVVGFANAGKTTFFNTATGLSKETGPVPFTTLNPKAYRVKLGTERELILIDTVGFVFNAPPEIIEAFKSTLEEISDSDGIIMVVDASEQIDYIHLKLKEAEKILNRLNSSHKPTLIFFNKMDLVTNENHLSSLRELCSNRDKFMISISECEFGSAFSIEDVEKALNKIINKLTLLE